MIAIVSSSGAANVGDLFYDIGPVGDVTAGYRPSLAVAGPTAERTRATIDRAWLAFFTRALSNDTWRSPLRRRLVN